MTHFANQPMHRLSVRPQPIGLFAGQGAHLLLPATCEASQSIGVAALQNLLQGKIKTSLPENWEFLRFAIQGEVEQANQSLEQLLRSDPSQGAIHEYNLFALQPTVERYLQLRESFHDELLLLLDATAYASGVAEHPPSLEALDSGIVTGELAAWLLAAAAANDIEHHELESAREKLKRGAELAKVHSPLLAAIFLAQAASLSPPDAELPPHLLKREYESAIRLASDCELPGFLAELWTQVGMLSQRSAQRSRDGLLEAIKAYQAAVHHLGDPSGNPQLFAELQNNLGLAYVTISSSETSDQLRYGIAIQSFRRALEMLSPESDGELWARISMNLASALQYAPSSHPADNLIQSVEIYEQVLVYRTRARDPVAYALTMLNQANALAHLGIFKPALEKASEAYKLFQWYEQTEQAIAARELVEQVNHQLAANQGGLAHGTP